jgi:hypothetical protein
LSGELCHGHVHASLADRVTQQSGESGSASEVEISTLTRDEDHLLLCALTDEMEEGIYDVDVAEEIVLDLRAA